MGTPKNHYLRLLRRTSLAVIRLFDDPAFDDLPPEEQDRHHAALLEKFRREKLRAFARGRIE